MELLCPASDQRRHCSETGQPPLRCFGVPTQCSSVCIFTSAQQEQLFGICKRFKDDVNQHLKNCRDITEDLEEHARELERNLEWQRATHTKRISQVEQEIKVQLDDAEKRILAVHEGFVVFTCRNNACFFMKKKNSTQCS